MFGDISVRDLAARMADHEEHVELSERYVGDCKEIHGGDRLAMIPQERKP
jgi:hypothetical protein